MPKYIQEGPFQGLSVFYYFGGPDTVASPNKEFPRIHIKYYYIKEIIDKTCICMLKINLKLREGLGESVE